MNNIYNTPIFYSEYFSRILESKFFFKREDLYPFFGGGSKARIVNSIINNIDDSIDYILTAGGPYSNFNRALALAVNKFEVKVKIVLYDKNTHLNNKNLNKRICDFCDIEFIRCNPNEVELTLEKEKENFVNKKLKFQYIWGGGKSYEGLNAYIECIKEIKDQINFAPDYIVTPIGTGTTYTGILLGSRIHLPQTKVIGISIARRKNEIFPVIQELLDGYNSVNYKKLSFKDIDTSNIYDDFIMGGYGLITRECENFIKKVVKNESIILDRIYVGKALYGFKILTDNIINIKEKNIIFLNTGGIYNF